MFTFATAKRSASQIVFLEAESAVALLRIAAQADSASAMTVPDILGAAVQCRRKTGLTPSSSAHSIRYHISSDSALE